MQNFLEKCRVLSFELFLITIPFQVQTLIYKAHFLTGQFNYFTSFFFNISEFFLLITFLIYGLEKLLFVYDTKPFLENFNKYDYYFVFSLLGLFAWILLSIFWSKEPKLALFFAFRFLELLILIYLILNEVIPRNKIIKYFAIGAGIQVFIGFIQYLKQGSLGLIFLGESQFGGDTLNIAKIDLGGEKIVRSYGTFSHSNIFGGYLLIALTLLLQNISKKNFSKLILLGLLFLFGILLSFSRSAWLATFSIFFMILTINPIKINWKYFLLILMIGIFSLVVLNLDKIIISRILDFSLQSIDQRLIYSDIASKMIYSHSFFGVGYGQFVLNMPDYYGNVLSPWLYQPVHNYWLMLFSELGVIGLLFWGFIALSIFNLIDYAMRRIIKSDRFYWKMYISILLGLLVLSLFDHYLYTTWPGQVLVTLVLGLIWMDFQKRKEELNK